MTNQNQVWTISTAKPSRDGRSWGPVALTDEERETLYNAGKR